MRAMRVYETFIPEGVSDRGMLAFYGEEPTHHVRLQSRIHETGEMFRWVDLASAQTGGWHYRREIAESVGHSKARELSAILKAGVRS
jgi:hypothetical protein